MALIVVDRRGIARKECVALGANGRQQSSTKGVRMSTTTTVPRRVRAVNGRAESVEAPSVWERLKSDPAYQAFWALRIGFAAVPILMGVDKFFDVMVNWEMYLAPWINDIVPGNATDAMHIV